jgi:membrane protein YdbS with pleckstrin-like domain
MAKTVKKRVTKVAKRQHVSPFGIYWEKKNYAFFFGGLILVVIGFYFMSIGNWDSFESLVISPIILTVAYIFIFPLSIFYKTKETEVQESEVK